MKKSSKKVKLRCSLSSEYFHTIMGASSDGLAVQLMEMFCARVTSCLFGGRISNSSSAERKGKGDFLLICPVPFVGEGWMTLTYKSHPNRSFIIAHFVHNLACQRALMLSLIQLFNSHMHHRIRSCVYKLRQLTSQTLRKRSTLCLMQICCVLEGNEEKLEFECAEAYRDLKGAGIQRSIG